ncbi:hypothetical protein BDV33DRAFT_168881 [Aspergillus novoparasiticus]|uniref:Uncharacterized protein n=1 Tax=Aspergillus novoparasiticus TaxID=986946 RepID=A0A5N6EZ41_9EURO|nr:hypothetical protein BDV33DRAFT_168881 [Aspergillus novoparasiticus]
MGFLMEDPELEDGRMKFTGDEMEEAPMLTVGFHGGCDAVFSVGRIECGGIENALNARVGLKPRDISIRQPSLSHGPYTKIKTKRY